MAKSDPQKTDLYRWEDRVIGPRGGAMIAFANAQALVNAVWMAAGLLHPPIVEKLSKNNKKAIAKANRNTVWLPEKIPTWIVLHEVAHSMAGTFDGDSDGHGPAYLWLYMTLVDRHLKIPMLELMATARAAGLEFQLGAKPMFQDAA